MQLDTLNAEECKYLVCERDYLSIRGGGSRAEGLDAELLEFSPSARLRLLVTEARNYVIKFDKDKKILYTKEAKNLII